MKPVCYFCAKKPSRKSRRNCLQFVLTETRDENLFIYRMCPRCVKAAEQKKLFSINQDKRFMVLTDEMIEVYRVMSA